MPWGVAAAAVGAGVSAALAPSPSGGSGGSGSYYVPTGLNSADTSWQQLLQQQLQAQQGIQGTQTGYGGYYQQRAGDASQQYSDLAALLQQKSQGAYGTQDALLAAGQNVYNLGLDPQNALYNRSVQQLQDQTGATNSMYGLGSSAAGAGVANQALGNFNIDWQNQQLQRAAQGLSAYTGAAGAAGQYGQYATGLAEQAPGYTLQSGATPYNVGMQLAGAPLTSAQSIQSNIIPYLNYGQGAQTVPYNAQQQGAGAAGALVGQGVQGLGNAYQNAGSWGNLFGGTTGSFGGGDFSGAFTSSPYYSGGGGNSYGFTMGP